MCPLTGGDRRRKKRRKNGRKRRREGGQSAFERLPCVIAAVGALVVPASKPVMSGSAVSSVQRDARKGKGEGKKCGRKGRRLGEQIDVCAGKYGVQWS